MIILLHSSKTMRAEPGSGKQPPLLLDKARRLDAYLKTLSPQQIAETMKVSPALAEKTRDLIAAWTVAPEAQTLAVASFTGDIYSGLQWPELSAADGDYAAQTLRILSGLYGILRPNDGICPYRLEMGYRLPDPPYNNLYRFWAEDIAACLPVEGPIVNLSADEYSRTVTPFVDPARMVAPRFLTVSPKTGKPEFVVVHAKIARGAFARWLIKKRVGVVGDLAGFDDIGYRFDANLSQPGEPVFVCQEFGGKGLSIRLR
jgi:uncharacterized protein